MKVPVTLFVVTILVAIGMPACANHIFVTTGAGGNNFSPSYCMVDPGDTITWVWMSGHHNTSSYSVPSGAGLWYSNIDQSSQQYTIVPTVSGLYKYTCTHHSGMDGSFFVTGCSFPVRPVISSSNGNSFCEGSETVLSATRQPGYKYQWINGTTTVPSDSNSYTASTSGNYKLIVNYCGVDSVSDAFAINMHPKPKPAFTYSNAGLSYIFTNNTPALNDHQFTWSFNDGSPVQTTVHANHTFSDSGKYKVTLEATHLASACVDSISIEIQARLNITSIDASYSIYPNPATSYISVRVDSYFEAWLTDVQGHMVGRSGNIQGKEQKLDVSGMREGLYFLHFKTERYHVVEKVLIDH